MTILPASIDAMGEAVRALSQCEVVAYPTETVYGLAVDPFSEQALDALFSVKKREDTHPVLLIVADEAQAMRLVSSVSDHARACMARFWPGPLSLLFPPRESVSPRLLGENGCICLRCPGYLTARDLCRRWGGALTSTSANLSGCPPARCAADAALPGVSLVLDGGVLMDSPPSTVYDPETRRILRQGPVTEAMLQDIG